MSLREAGAGDVAAMDLRSTGQTAPRLVVVVGRVVQEEEGDVYVERFYPEQSADIGGVVVGGGGEVGAYLLQEC